VTQHPRHHNHTTTNPPEHSPTAISGRTNRVQGGAGQGRAGRAKAVRTTPRSARWGSLYPRNHFVNAKRPDLP